MNQPHDLELEQTLLGSVLMYGDAAMERVGDFLRPDHFFDPLHGEIYAAVLSRFQRGENCKLMAIKPLLGFMETREDCKQVGGLKYLAKLAGAAMPASGVEGYGTSIVELANRRGLIEVADMIRDQAINGGVDASAKEIVEGLEDEIANLSDQSARKQPVSIAEVAIKMEARKGVDGISSGLHAFDAANGLMMPGDLIVVGGATSMGKTALCQQLLWNAAKGGSTCLAISMEMSKEQYVARHMAQLTSISTDKIESWNMAPDEEERCRRARDSIENLPLWIEDGRGLKAVNIRAICRRQKRKHGLDLVLIDHLGFVAKDNWKMSGLEAMEHNVSAIKTLALEINTPVILISHLNRGLWARDDKRPQLSDLHGASAIEKDADVVCFVHREEYWLSKQRPDLNSKEYAEWGQEMATHKGLAEIINGKRRRGEAGKVFTCQFDAERTAFKNMAEREAA